MRALLLCAALLLAVGSITELQHAPSGACAREGVEVWAEERLYVCADGQWGLLVPVAGRCPVCGTDGGETTWHITTWDEEGQTGIAWKRLYACPRCGNLFTEPEGGGDE